MKIRQAALSDAPAIERMSHSFLKAIDEPFDVETVRDSIFELMTAPHCAMLIDDSGHAMLGATSHPQFFDSSKRVAREICWWADEDSRGSGIAKALLVAAEDWARSIGATEMHMIALDALGGRLVGRIYKRAGYEPLEQVFRKVL